ncbi:MAG: hypothetical protein R3C10_25285 [Pirellulales bacterium]
MDYLAWASNYGAGAAVVTAAPTRGTTSVKKRDVMDIAFEQEFSGPATHATDQELAGGWRGQAVDSVLKRMADNRYWWL